MQVSSIYLQILLQKKINDIWDDVDGWWNQSHVQDARRQFCDHYAKTSHNPLMEIKKILLS